MPLPQIVQPVLWAYAADTLNLTPEPDYLILADEVEDSYNKFTLNELNDFQGKSDKVIHVINPGNFATDSSFTVVYPYIGQVDPSRLWI